MLLSTISRNSLLKFQNANLFHRFFSNTSCRVFQCHSTNSQKDAPTENPAKIEGETSENSENIDYKQQFEKSSQQIEELKASFAEMKDKYLRSLAEMENVRTRSEIQVKNAKAFGNQSFSKDLINVADVLRLAIQSVPTDALKSSQGTDCGKLLTGLYEGIVMTENQLHKVFQDNGLKSFSPLGEKFDPNFHEAMFEVDDPSKEASTVGVVVKTGYTLHERVLRAAQVGVVKTRSE
eukprot:Sdes_comp8994_c0_seq1m407